MVGWLRPRLSAARETLFVLKISSMIAKCLRSISVSGPSHIFQRVDLRSAIATPVHRHIVSELLVAFLTDH
jgi:hypothetical protein